MSAELPHPPISPGVDLRNVDGFMLNVERLMASELWALSTGDEAKAAVTLWCRAWKQVPAASLPDDDRVLATWAGVTVPKFRKIRDMAMRGFVKCSDGRWYHPVLAADAARAWDSHKAYLERRAKDRRRLDDWRKRRSGQGDDVGDTPVETLSETSSETRFSSSVSRRDVNANGTTTPTGRDSLFDGAPAPRPSRDQGRRGTRIPEGLTLTPEWRSCAEEARAKRHLPAVDLDLEFDRFTGHYTANGKPMKDWKAAWRNWAISPYVQAPTTRSAPSSPSPKLDAGRAALRIIGGGAA